MQKLHKKSDKDHTTFYFCLLHARLLVGARCVADSITYINYYILYIL